MGRGIDGLFRETGCHIHVLTLSWLTNGLLLSQARVTARARPLQLVFPANRPKRVHDYTTVTSTIRPRCHELTSERKPGKKGKQKKYCPDRSGENPRSHSITTFFVRSTERNIAMVHASRARGYSCRSSLLLHIYRAPHCAGVSRDADIFCRENSRY